MPIEFREDAPIGFVMKLKSPLSAYFNQQKLTVFNKNGYDHAR